MQRGRGSGGIQRGGRLKNLFGNARPSDAAGSAVVPETAEPSTGGRFTVQKLPCKILVPGTYVMPEGGEIQYFPGFLSKQLADYFYATFLGEIPFATQELTIRGQKIVQPRLTAWYGDFPYSYSGLTLDPIPFSDHLNQLRQMIQKHVGHSFNSALANLYRDCKDSVDWHADFEPSLGPCPIIASISLGDSRRFLLRSKSKWMQERLACSSGGDHSGSGGNESTGNAGAWQPSIYRNAVREGPAYDAEVLLEHGSLVLMAGPLQENYVHCVPKEYHDRDPRINITFRTILETQTSGGDARPSSSAQRR